MNPRGLCHRAGFTLAEMLVAMAILTVVVAISSSLFITFLRSYNTTTLLRNSSSQASLGLARMVYGIGGNAGLREADASSVTITYPSGGWRLQFNSNLFYQYSTTTKSIVDQNGKTICTNLLSSTLQNLTNSCLIQVAVVESAGGRVFTNRMQTRVQYRN